MFQIYNAKIFWRRTTSNRTISRYIPRKLKPRCNVGMKDFKRLYWCNHMMDHNNQYVVGLTKWWTILWFFNFHYHFIVKQWKLNKSFKVEFSPTMHQSYASTPGTDFMNRHQLPAGISCIAVAKKKLTESPRPNRSTNVSFHQPRLNWCLEGKAFSESS